MATDRFGSVRGYCHDLGSRNHSGLTGSARRRCHSGLARTWRTSLPLANKLLDKGKNHAAAEPYVGDIVTGAVKAVTALGKVGEKILRAIEEMTHYYYYYYHFYYWFGCLKVPSSGQQAFLRQWVSPEIDACLCGKVGIASGPRASWYGQRCAAVAGLHLIQIPHTAEVTVPISQQLH